MQVTAAEAREVFGLSLRDVLSAIKGWPVNSACGKYTLVGIEGASVQAGLAFTVRDSDTKAGQDAP